MVKLKNNLLEESEAIAIIAGMIIGIGILSLPSVVVKDAEQDGWISVIIGGLYPMFMTFLSIYYKEKHPNENILTLSKKYLGKTLGTICNILFTAQFLVYIIGDASGFTNAIIVHATSFLTPIKILIPSIFLAIYLSNKGINVLARINVIALYFTVILALTLITALQKGDYLNILPILGSGYRNILKGAINSAYSYGGVEIIFLIYPMIRKKDKMKAIAVKAAIIPIVINFWVTFISIYYLGYRVTNKTIWSVLLVTEAVNWPALNSFRFLFLFLWSIVIFKVLANGYYVFTYGLSDVAKIKNKKSMYFYLFPIIIYLCLKVGNETQRMALINFIIPKSTLFTFTFVTIIAILIFIKHKK